MGTTPMLCGSKPAGFPPTNPNAMLGMLGPGKKHKQFAGRPVLLAWLDQLSLETVRAGSGLFLKLGFHGCLQERFHH